VSADKPRLSIALPVYNGEKYVKQALDSILNQTYRDFELIICDNASTDKTAQICQEYAARDSRIQYYRNERNIGCPKNFNRSFELCSSGVEYFKWVASDDLHSPDFLERCIQVLDCDPSVVLCHSKISVIDKNGDEIGNCDNRTLVNSSSPFAHIRFGDLISMKNPCWAIFGVMRSDSLRKTPLLGDYIGADRNLLAELGLMGKVYELPKYLFFRRDHSEAYTRKYCENEYALNIRNLYAQTAWWSADKFTYFPNWKDCDEFFKSIRRVRLSRLEKLCCYIEIWQWFMNEGWRYMLNDVKNLLLLRSFFARKLLSLPELRFTSTILSILRKIRYL